MAVREFVDESGKRWRVWAVTPANIHPATKIEEYVDDIYHTGWLVFETVSADEKRRLLRFPPHWADAPERELRAMLARAEPVQTRPVDTAYSPRHEERHQRSSDAPEPDPALTTAAAQAIRTFRYPGGRYWTVCVDPHAEDGAPPALRFTAGVRNIELTSWPRDWTDFTDAQLIDLLRWAAPRIDRRQPPPGIPRRRWDDPPVP